MGRSQREKGARGERELVAFLSEFGVFARRCAQFGAGDSENPDVRHSIPDVHIECKRTERLRMQEAVDQAIADSGEGQRPLVCHKANRKEWLAVLRLEDLLEILGYERKADATISGNVTSGADDGDGEGSGAEDH